jgi:serine protease Do
MKLLPSSLLFACSLVGSVFGEVVVIDDAKILRGLEKEMSDLAETGVEFRGEKVSDALHDAGKNWSGKKKCAQVEGGSYAELSESVFVIAHAFNCGKCDNWHLGGVATAWCLGSDGIMVTNYHVLDNAAGEAWAICSRDGKVFPVVEILAASKKEDLAIFRVEGSDFKGLPLGKPAEVGSEVRVLSHPNRKLFMQTIGEVSRYFNQRIKGGSAVRMAITADYAKGSSGGPVFNKDGEVVGVVASTNSIYYGKDDDGDATNLQMVIKNTIPVSALRKMLE